MRDMILEMVDEMLDMDGDVQIGNLTFSRSAIVREMDPTAYRMIVSEFVDAEIENFQYDIDHMDEETDADEIAELKQRIEDLENFSY